MKFVRVNQPTKSDLNSETQTLENNADTQDSNLVSTFTQNSNLEIPTTQYKQFVKEERPIDPFTQKPAFKLPKFLAQREETKSKLEDFKNKSNEKQSSIGNLPFTSPNFSDNPNSFTSIFNKDHEKINGVQRVFRKSISFLIDSTYFSSTILRW